MRITGRVVRWATGLRLGRKSFHGDSRLVGRVDETGAIEKQGAAGIDGEGCGLGTPHDFDGPQPDHGYIETHILARLGDLYDDKGLARREPRRPLDGFVGSFHGFEGHASAVADDHGLAQIEPGYMPGDFAAVGNIGRFTRIRSAPSENAGVGQ
jgi:hypothetical protein